MQENTTIARPYAAAAFEQALEEGKLGEWSTMLQVLKMVISDKQMKFVLDNPRLGDDAVAEFVIEICGKYLSGTGKNFVKVLAQAGRLVLAPHIYTLFEQKRTEAESIVEIEVTSAYALDETEKNKISEAMAKRLGRKIEINTSTDASLIGGAVIRTGDSVIDASVKGRLKKLGNQLAE